jgi:hypothetical protein
MQALSFNAGKISFSSKGVSIDGANVSVSGSVNYNPNGEHIAAVEVFLLRNLGYQSDELTKAAAIIYERDKDNPFFEYLANGRTPRMLQLILNKCPSLDQPSVSRFQSFPERGEELQKDRNKTGLGREHVLGLYILGSSLRAGYQFSTWWDERDRSIRPPWQCS